MALRDAIASFRFDLDVTSLRAANKEVDAVIKTLDLGRLSTQLAKAQDGNAALAASFRELGVSFEDAEGKLVPLDEQMRQAVAGLDKMEDGTTKTRLASQLAGGRIEALRQNVSVLRPQLDKAAAKLRAFQDEARDHKPVRTLRQQIEGLGTTLSQYGRYLGAAAALGGAAAGISRLGQWVAGTAAANAELGRFASATGVTARELGQWEMIAGRAGLSVDTIREALAEFSNRSGDVANGNKSIGEAFAKLGISATTAEGQTRSLNDRFTESVTKLGQIEDVSQRQFLAEEIFGGEAGKAVIRVALQGADALAKQRAEFDALYGGGSFDAYVQNSEKATQALTRWRESSGALKASLMATFIPILTRVATAFARLAGWLARTTQGTQIVEVGLGLLATAAVVAGGAITAAFAAPIATFLAIAAAIFAIVLIVEDLYQLFSGGESAIGSLLDGLFGVGAAKTFVDSVTHAFVTMFETVEKVINAVDDLIDKANKAADAVIGLFGGTTSQDVRAQEDLLAAAQADYDAELARIDAILAASDARMAARQTAPVASDTRARVSPGAIQTVNLASSPVINISGASGDPREIARQVMSEMDRARQAELRTVRDELAGS